MVTMQPTTIGWELIASSSSFSERHAESCNSISPECTALRRGIDTRNRFLCTALRRGIDTCLILLPLQACVQRNLKEKTFRLYVGVVQVLHRNIAGTGRTPSVQPKAMTGLAWCCRARTNTLQVLHSPCAFSCPAQSRAKRVPP